jgi:hypothetical protein
MALRDLPRAEASQRAVVAEMPEKGTNRQPAAADPGLRRMLIWVFGALILTVLAAVLAVEFTLRWFGER